MELARELWLALPEFGRARQSSGGGREQDVTWHGRAASYPRGSPASEIDCLDGREALGGDLDRPEHGPRVPPRLGGHRPERAHESRLPGLAYYHPRRAGASLRTFRSCLA